LGSNISSDEPTPTPQPISARGLRRGANEGEPAFVPDVRPTPSRPRAALGVVELVLDEGQTVKAVGVIYGLEHTIRGDGFEAVLFLDHYNQRIKILEYRATNFEALILRVRATAEANGFDKIVVMATHDDWLEFLRFGYVLEAVIRHYHRGEDAFVVSKFRSQDRLTSTALMEETLLIEQIMADRSPSAARALPDSYEIGFAHREDIPELVALYSAIFESYPSPLIHASYLETVFGTDTVFAVCRSEGVIVAAASVELHASDLAAEMTDCATLPTHRGHGLMTHLLRYLERELERRSYVCAYTMARARSFGMNAVFHGMGYEFMGRLVNNCDIYGAYEDMNIWVRRLGTPSEGTSG
jgi:putative beta-lysine N-acetyltransferase